MSHCRYCGLTMFRRGLRIQSKQNLRTQHRIRTNASLAVRQCTGRIVATRPPVATGMGPKTAADGVTAQ